MVLQNKYKKANSARYKKEHSISAKPPKQSYDEAFPSLDVLSQKDNQESSSPTAEANPSSSNLWRYEEPQDNDLHDDSGRGSDASVEDDIDWKSIMSSKQATDSGKRIPTYVPTEQDIEREKLDDKHKATRLVKDRIRRAAARTTASSSFVEEQSNEPQDVDDFLAGLDAQDPLPSQRPSGPVSQGSIKVDENIDEFLHNLTL